MSENNYLEDVEKAKLPPEFLMEMMEINEALMELEMDFQQEEFEAAKKAYKEANDDLQASLERIEKEFEEGGVAEDTYKKLKDYYLKNKYLLRIKETLNKFAAHS